MLYFNRLFTSSRLCATMKIKMLLLFTLALICGPVFAVEPLRIVGDEWPPYVDESLPGNGLSVEIVTEALKKSGYATHFALEDLSRAIAGARIGVYDVVSNIWYSEDAATDLDFTDPYLSNEMCFIKRKGVDIEYAFLSDLRGMVVGVVKDYPYPREFVMAGDIIKIPVPTMLPALNALAAGQINLVLGDRRDIDFLLAKFMPQEAKTLEYMPPCFPKNDLFAAVSKTNPNHAKITQDFNAALKRMKTDGSYQFILDKHSLEH
ncbi:transporter substrate-binding domain-containing protein [Candidatus Methylospira mobilis]|uniref:Transporter substrate-binding domain-containing protein n=2 Tax=Candidatus Methylospira mobilis TaxID=1808979 RepID=A0A5Q0BCM3_9GAMM|nr:transporter substrate-binding domain-containing protein [Candidatus Methylospira mobilis]